MMAHWLILSAAVSLGGMASLGVMHYLSVEEGAIAIPDELVSEKEVQVQTAKQDFTKELNQLKAELRDESVRRNEELTVLVEELITHLEGLREVQDAQTQQLKLMSRELTTMEFKMETFDRSFVPLPEAESSALRSIETSRLNSLLLPPK